VADTQGISRAGHFFSQLNIPDQTMSGNFHSVLKKSKSFDNVRVWQRAGYDVVTMDLTNQPAQGIECSTCF
jgi:hypothetical protein